MPKYDFKSGDVVGLRSTSARWFALDQGPFLVKSYPSKLGEWEPETAETFVDIVTMDGKPPNFTGECINACANANECIFDVFLTAAREAAGIPFPNPPIDVDRHGWDSQKIGYGRDKVA